MSNIAEEYFICKTDLIDLLEHSRGAVMAERCECYLSVGWGELELVVTQGHGRAEQSRALGAALE